MNEECNDFKLKSEIIKLKCECYLKLFIRKICLREYECKFINLYIYIINNIKFKNIDNITVILHK